MGLKRCGAFKLFECSPQRFLVLFFEAVEFLVDEDEFVLCVLNGLRHGDLMEPSAFLLLQVCDVLLCPFGLVLYGGVLLFEVCEFGHGFFMLQECGLQCGNQLWRNALIDSGFHVVESVLSKIIGFGFWWIVDSE